MRISTFCFAIAATAALFGMSLGIFMGMSGDFTLAPAHAHINLLGWVTMAIYGAYHRGVERPGQRLAWTQVSMGAVGFPLMAVGLGVYLATGEGRIIPVVIVGSLLCLGSMLLFLITIVLDARRARANGPTNRTSLPQLQAMFPG